MRSVVPTSLWQRTDAVACVVLACVAGLACEYIVPMQNQKPPAAAPKRPEAVIARKRQAASEAQVELLELQARLQKAKGTLDACHRECERSEGLATRGVERVAQLEASEVHRATVAQDELEATAQRLAKDGLSGCFSFHVKSLTLAPASQLQPGQSVVVSMRLGDTTYVEAQAGASTAPMTKPAALTTEGAVFQMTHRPHLELWLAETAVTGQDQKVAWVECYAIDSTSPGAKTLIAQAAIRLTNLLAHVAEPQRTKVSMTTTDGVRVAELLGDVGFQPDQSVHTSVPTPVAPPSAEHQEGLQRANAAALRAREVADHAKLVVRRTEAAVEQLVLAEAAQSKAAAKAAAAARVAAGNVPTGETVDGAGQGAGEMPVLVGFSGVQWAGSAPTWDMCRAVDPDALLLHLMVRAPALAVQQETPLSGPMEPQRLMAASLHSLRQPGDDIASDGATDGDSGADNVDTHTAAPNVPEHSHDNPASPTVPETNEAGAAVTTSPGGGTEQALLQIDEPGRSGAEFDTEEAVEGFATASTDDDGASDGCIAPPSLEKFVKQATVRGIVEKQKRASLAGDIRNVVKIQSIPKLKLDVGANAGRSPGKRSGASAHGPVYLPEAVRRRNPLPPPRRPPSPPAVVVPPVRTRPRRQPNPVVGRTQPSSTRLGRSRSPPRSAVRKAPVKPARPQTARRPAAPSSDWARRRAGSVTSRKSPPPRRSPSPLRTAPTSPTPSTSGSVGRGRSRFHTKGCYARKTAEPGDRVVRPPRQALDTSGSQTARVRPVAARSPIRQVAKTSKDDTKLAELEKQVRVSHVQAELLILMSRGRRMPGGTSTRGVASPIPTTAVSRNAAGPAGCSSRRTGKCKVRLQVLLGCRKSLLTWVVGAELGHSMGYPSPSQPTRRSPRLRGSVCRYEMPVMCGPTTEAFSDDTSSRSWKHVSSSWKVYCSKRKRRRRPAPPKPKQQGRHLHQSAKWHSRCSKT